MIKSLVVSTTGAGNREGWPYIDAIPNDKVCSPDDAPLPVGLHYCKRYLLGKWFFSKYRLKKKYISCETPLLKPPPLDLAAQNYTSALSPPPHGHDGSEWNPVPRLFTASQAKREAFMLCAMIRKINEAAIHFKTTACDGKANLVKKYTFWEDPHH